MKQLARIQSLVLLLCLLATLTAWAQGTYRNQRIFVVPPPGPMAIDGELKDWDLSGEIITYVSEATMDFQTMHTAMMYDEKALYLSCRVDDPSPMMNRYDPAVNPDYGWDADAFQLRLSLDPALGYPLKIGLYDRSPSESLVHMTMWYYTDDKKPVLHAKYGMDFHDKPEYPKGIVPGDKFQAAYKAWPDGKGYTLEYRIPWSTLGAKRAMKAGEMTAGTLQIQWGNPQGTHYSGSGVGIDLMRTAGFSYQSTNCWGKVIFTEKGNLPKELTQEGLPAVRKLPLKFTYTLPKESDVSVALINEKGDVVRHIMAAEKRPQGTLTESWDGIDDEGNILPAGTYKWIGAYHDPFATKYVMSVGNSGNPGYHTSDGKGAWGGDWANPMDVCFAGDKALLAWAVNEAGHGIIMVDGKGVKQWGGRYGATYLATDGEWLYAYLSEDKQVRAYQVADGRQTNFLRGEMWAEHSDGKATICTGLAWSAGKLYVANAAANTVTEYDARKGTILRTLNVPAPSWLAAAGPGTLAAISKGQVLKVAVADGKATPWLTTNLDAPQGVTVGPDGTLYVSNAGNLQNISVFNAAGKYLRSIGKQGGRALPPALRMTEGHAVSIEQRGAWQPNTLLNPRGLAVNPSGQLWVMEDDFQPKRISVWNAKSGKLIEEKFGACYVSTPVCIDPADPTRVYTQNIEWKVDLDKGTWKANAVMIDMRPDAPWFWPHMINNIVFTAKNGKQYMSGAGGWYGVANGGKGSFLYIRRGDHFEGAAGVIYPGMPLSWRKDLKADDPRVTGSLFWTDINGDGLIQEAETAPTKFSARMPMVADADLNLYGYGGFDHLYWERLSPAQILPNGVPVYDEAGLKHVTYADGSPLYTHDIAVNPADGSVIMYAGARWKWMKQLKVWPITYWTKDGKMVWRYYKGCEWPDMYELPVPKAGELYGSTKCIGIVDGITGFSNYFGTLQFLTTDGLMLGMIMKDGRVDADGPDRINCEWFTGQLVKIKDGRWFLLAGDQDGRVLEVQGLNSIKRFAGTLTITDADVKAAAESMANWTSEKARAQSVVLSRTLDAPDWPNIRGVNIVQDERRQFTAKASYDAENLYVRYEVMSPSELVNSIPEPQFLFKGGNVLDLQLATDPAADAKRTTPAPGDLRVLITRRDGKPMAVVYRHKVAGFAGDPMITFTSPTGKETVDKFDVWNDVTLTYEKTEMGFNAVVTLPLARLGWKPVPGTTVKMDVGYIFGNATGNATSVRKYWSNHSFTAGVTADVPSEGRIEPALWGVATVE